jgi:flagellin
MTTGTAPLSSAAFFNPFLLGLKHNTDDLTRSVGRLASGYRVTHVGDDVAAITVATQLKSQVSGFKQAAQNAAQGGSLIQVAAGALSEVSDLLDSLQALATQANNSSLLDADRVFLQTQFSETLDEIDRVAANTTFNDISLLDGTFNENFQVGTSPDDTINVTIDSVATDDLFNSTPNISTEVNAAAAQTAIEDAIETVTTIISAVSGLQQRFSIAGTNADIASGGAEQGRSTLVDTDIPSESIELVESSLRVNVAVSVIAQAQNLQSGLLDVLRFSGNS